MKGSRVLAPMAGLIISAASSDVRRQVLNAFGEPSYGVDVSFPIHHINLRDDDDRQQLLGDRQASYDEFVAGCGKLYNIKACEMMEADRVAMCLNEPPATQNYTEVGWKKVQAPTVVAELLQTFWETHRDKRQIEDNRGNLFVNHWSSPTYLVSIEDQSLSGGGNYLKQKVWDGVKPVLEGWTGVELDPVFMYGIREYTNGAILTPHVDRKPLIISVILNVAQDVEEDWPLEVYGRDGLAYNVTMEPGDMFMYESHSIIHGRPFILRGKYFANVLINFQPTGKTLREGDTSVFTGHGKVKTRRNMARGSPKDKKRRRSRSPQEQAKTTKEASPDATPRQRALAHAAASGDVHGMIRLTKHHKDLLQEKDSNGWQPIHEAARGGHVDAVKLLVERGANIHERTDFGEGPSLLEIVLEEHGEGHPLVGYLESLGAEL